MNEKIRTSITSLPVRGCSTGWDDKCIKAWIFMIIRMSTREKKTWYNVFFLEKARRWRNRKSHESSVFDKKSSIIWHLLYQIKSYHLVRLSMFCLDSSRDQFRKTYESCFLLYSIPLCYSPGWWIFIALPSHLFTSIRVFSIR